MSRPVGSAAGRATLVLVALAATGSLAAADVIKEIDVQENTKTTDETVILISGLERGDDFGVDEITTIRERLVSSGLFKFVDVFTQPVAGGVKVVLIAKDKHSWVIAPTYYNQPTNKGGGLGFGENNLFGTNKKLLLYGQIATGDSFFIGAYVDPSLAGTRFRWQWDVYLASSRVIEYAAPDEYATDTDPVRESRMNYLNSGLRLGMTLFRGATIDARIRGAHVDYTDVELAGDAELSDVTDDPAATGVPEPGGEGWDVSAEGMIGYDNRANWYGITHGDKIKLAYERGLPGLGSDFDYWYAAISLARARRYFTSHNLDIRGYFAYGEDLPFQQEFTAGGTGLRGYKNAQFRGDLKGSLNVEYSVPVFTIKGFALRALAFADAAYTTLRDRDDGGSRRNYLPDADSHGLSPMKTSFGLGTRVYLRQIVLPLLGLDVGYGPERGAFEIYLAIGLTDY
jgi:outer membrane protein insertion porin family